MVLRGAAAALAEQFTKFGRLLHSCVIGLNLLDTHSYRIIDLIYVLIWFTHQIEFSWQVGKL